MMFTADQPESALLADIAVVEPLPPYIRILFVNVVHCCALGFVLGLEVGSDAQGSFRLTDS